MLITLDICSTLAHKHMEKDISKKNRFKEVDYVNITHWKKIKIKIFLP